MTYQEALDYIFQQLPMYQRVGAKALKIDLSNITALAERLGNPQNGFKSVHIAGTNGKGSTAHILAAILQTAGYKVGLYTSPHYRDFRERIKINGEYITQQAVVDFITQNQAAFETVRPSYFEMTVAMAFDYFNKEQVDIAVIETGLGGRLDSTNIITPLLSIITNIGMDHEATLGNTLGLIAGEKAGIIKPNVPVIIGETHPETTPVFIKKAQEVAAPINFVNQVAHATVVKRKLSHTIYDISSLQLMALNLPELALDLTGDYQIHNLKNALVASQYLNQANFKITPQHLYDACANVQGISKILGRWQILKEQPLTICDSGHNGHGLAYTNKALINLNKKQLHIVWGLVNDKDLSKVLPLLPKDAIYYFCKANIPRGLDAEELQQSAANYSLQGQAYDSVPAAFEAAQAAADLDDCVFVGGSIFTVAEVV